METKHVFFYLKIHQINKKFTERKDCYYFLFPFLSLAHFESMFHRILGVSVFLGHI